MEQNQQSCWAAVNNSENTKRKKFEQQNTNFHVVRPLGKTTMRRIFPKTNKKNIKCVRPRKINQDSRQNGGARKTSREVAVSGDNLREDTCTLYPESPPRYTLTNKIMTNVDVLAFCGGDRVVRQVRLTDIAFVYNRGIYRYVRFGVARLLSEAGENIEERLTQHRHVLVVHPGEGSVVPHKHIVHGTPRSRDVNHQIPNPTFYHHSMLWRRSALVYTRQTPTNTRCPQNKIGHVTL